MITTETPDPNTTTTAPTGAPVSLPIWVIADDAALLARAARALQDEHVELVLDVLDEGEPRDGVVRLWSVDDRDGAAELQRLLAGAGIPAVVSSTEVLDPDTKETPDDPAALRMLTAYHEAGHAVAGCMRGSVLCSVRLCEDGDGLTVHRGPSWDNPFATYAGPWAETRFIWGDRPADEETEDYLVFADRLFDVFLGCGAGDRKVLSEHFASYTGLAAMLPPEVTAGDLERVIEQKRTCELEAVWPAIETVATSLLAGEEITHASVNALLEAC